MILKDTYKTGGETKNKIMENKIKFSKEEQKDFNFWKQDGNVSKNEDGSYSTQDAQWTNRLKDLDALKEYYFKEFLNGSRYAGGGTTSKLKVFNVRDIKVGDKIYARWNDRMSWTIGIFKGETKNGFEVYDRTIERPEYIEFYAQISKSPPPYGDKKIFYSKNFKDRNYKNYHFIKEIQQGNYKKGGRTMQNIAKKQARKDIKTHLYRPQFPDVSSIKPSEKWARYELPYDTKLQYDFEPDSFSVQGNRYSEYAKGGKISAKLKKLKSEMKQIWEELDENYSDKKEMLMSAGYNGSDANDLKHEEWNYLGNEVQIKLINDYFAYYENLAVYVQGVGSIYNGTSMQSAVNKANSYLKNNPKAEIVISDEKYGDTYDLDGYMIDKDEYAEGGEAGFDDTGTSMVMYHEKKGNFFVAKDTVYLWFYNVENSAEKIESGEFDYVLYPFSSLGMMGQKGFIPPLKKIWTKKFQKKTKGSEHLLGVIKAFLIEEKGKKELYIDMMSVNPTKKKKGVMSYMIKDLRDTFDLTQEQITFSDLTDEGKKFLAKKTYDDGGGIGDEGKLKFEDLVGKYFEIELGSSGTSTEWESKELLAYLKKVVTHNLFDSEFYYNWTDSDEQKQYLDIFTNDTLNEIFKNVTNALNKYFEFKTTAYSTNKKVLVFKYSNDFRDDWIDNWFKTNKKISVKLKVDYKRYREKYAGVTPYAYGGDVENKIQLKNFSDLKQGDVIRKKEKLGTTIFVVNKSPVQSRIYKNEYDVLVTCIVSNTNFYKPFEEYYITSVIKYGKLGNVDYLGKWNYDDKIDYSIYLPKSNKKYADGGEAGYELENYIISGKNFKNKYATDFNGQVAKVIYTKNLDLGSNLGKGSYWNVTQDSLDIYSGKRDEELDSKYGQYFKNTIYKKIDDNLKIFVKDEIADELWDNEKLYNKIKNISDGIYDPSYDDYGLLLFENQYADGGEASELNIGQIFEVNRDSEKGKKYFDFHYGKGYVFIISDIFNEKVIDENQFWDAHIKLKVYDSNLKYIFPIRVFFKGKPYGLNLTKKLFSELLSDKSIFPSDNYYVEKESDYDRQEREFKGNGYVELIKRKINPIWKSIIDKFSEIYFSNGTDNDYLVSDQVKARGSNPYSSYEFRNFSPLLSWADAEGKFKQSLTADELNSIEISYNTEEYADLEEHDTEKYHKQIVVKLKTYADGGDVPHEDKMFQLPLEMVIYVPSTQDVNKVISIDDMILRVDEVKKYLANKFGGYTSADKLGGYVDSTGNLVNEDVVQVTSFSTKEAYAENKEELINQLAKWCEEWGQESIGFEFEGDLMYVPNKFKKGGRTKNM